MDVPAELDAALHHLRAHGHPTIELDGPPNLLAGGFWAEMWSLRLTPDSRGDLPARLVLRLAPDAQLAAWETTFQAVVAEQGFPTPRVRAYDFRPAASLRAWSVMDHADGAAMLAGLSGPRALVALPRLLGELPRTLATVAAELHQLDPEPMKAALARLPGREPGVKWLLDRYATRARELADVALQRTVERLAATTPPSEPLVLCHGDLHPFNVLTTASGPVVLDWTNGQIIHPAFDLAFTHLLLSHPPLATPSPLRPVINFAARRLGKRFLGNYRELSPHVVDDDTLTWFRTLHACRILLDLAGWRADGTTAEHRGHPWFHLEPALLPLLG